LLSAKFSAAPENRKKNRIKAMKNFIVPTILTFILFAAGCDSLTKPAAVSDGKTNINTAVSQTTNSAAPDAANVSPTPATNKNAAANVKKTPSAESLPRKIDKDTAESPVYAFNSKNCEREATDDFIYKCKAYGDYILTGGGYEGINNYSIEPKNQDAGFYVDLMPLSEGDAKEFLRNEKFVQKLGDKITWLLDDKGKPYAIFVHASFYKAAGGAKTFANPKNKVAEFVFLRGLSKSEEMDHDIDAVDTVYNPDEWAKKIAYEVREKSQK
jgi:hypothetical protein